jgi:hypothetical protein
MAAKSSKPTGLRVVLVLLLVWAMTSAFVHLLFRQPSDRAGTPILLGAKIPLPVTDVLARACANCHSEKTRWPWYSYAAPVSWLIESDVKHAREHFNLSRWDGLSSAEQRRLLTAIATVIENREMPPRRYLVFHPEANLSADDSVLLIEWTRSERRRLRAAALGLTTK